MRSVVIVSAFAILAVASTVLASDKGRHAHKSPHGGEVQTVGKYHLEGLVKDGKLVVYLLDGEENPLPAPAEAKATVLMGKMKHDLVLKLDGDCVSAALPAGMAGQKMTAVVTLTLDGKAESARFSLAAASDADHGKKGHGH